MSVATPSLELRLLEGPTLQRSRWQLVHPFRIGRAPGSEITLAEPSVSRRHAVIEAQSDEWTVRDCGSHLGTRVNELPLDTHVAAVLHVGDVLGIGAWRFRVEASSHAAAVEALSDTQTRISVVRGLGNLAEQRLELLLRCAGEVTAADNEQSLADAVVESALLGSGYARAAFLVVAGDVVKVRSLRPVAQSGQAILKISHSLLDSARCGEIAQLEPDQIGALQHTAQSTHRALCAPVMLDAQAEAFLYLESQRSLGHRHQDAPSFCHALARLAALALANLRRIASEREHAALAADLERARDVQRQLLPPERGCMAGVDYRLHLHPGRVVAGDIVDIFALSDGRIAAVLGDVSGTGLGAGLDMVSVQSFLRAQLAHDADPAHAATRLNRHLHERSVAGRFVTLWLGIFDAKDRSCRFVDAGHGHVVRVSDSRRSEPLAVRGDIPLGMEAEVVFRAEALVLAQDERLLLYSDGAVEQESPSGNAFGRERLLAATEGAATPVDLVDRVLDGLRRHSHDAPPDDDMTLLALGWSRD